MNSYDLMFLMEITGFDPHLFWRHKPEVALKRLQDFIKKKAFHIGLKEEVKNIEEDILDYDWIYNMMLKFYDKKKG